MLKNTRTFLLNHRQYAAFAALLIVGLSVGLAQVYRSYVINAGYQNPSPLMSSRRLFEYAAFAFIALIFPWNLKKAGDQRLKKLASIILTGLCFVLIYLFILSVLEWSASRKSYDLWNGYIFTIYHSGPIALLTYSIIAGTLYFAGITNDRAATSPTYLKRIEFKLDNITSFLSVTEIRFLEANDNYVAIHLDSGGHQLVRKTIREFEQQLDPKFFQRIHRGYIVNVKKVSSWKSDPNGGYIIFFPDGTNVKMSRSYKSKLKLLKESR